MSATASGAQVFHEELSGEAAPQTTPPMTKERPSEKSVTIVKWWPVILCAGGFFAQYVGMSGKIDLLLEQSKQHGAQLQRIEAKVNEHDTFIAIQRDRELREKK